MDRGVLAATEDTKIHSCRSRRRRGQEPKAIGKGFRGAVKGKGTDALEVFETDGDTFHEINAKRLGVRPRPGQRRAPQGVDANACLQAFIGIALVLIILLWIAGY